MTPLMFHEPLAPTQHVFEIQKPVTIDEQFYKRLISKKKHRLGGCEFVNVPTLKEFKPAEPNFGWRKSSDYIL